MASSKGALVTGRGKRGGRRAEGRAPAGRGYALVIHYRSSAAEATETVNYIRSRGVPAIGIQADLTDESAVRGLIEQTLGHFGRLDVLVNAAATWKSKKLEDVTAADIR